MSHLWIDGERAMTLAAQSIAMDPGTGRSRYQQALDLLRASDSEVALASFCFDPMEAGSAVFLDAAPGTNPTPGEGDLEVNLIDDGTEKWRFGFEEMHRSIKEGRVSKVVLARHVRMRASELIDSRELAGRLASANPAGFVFAMGGLVGASPELLLRLESRRVTTRVLAGTATSETELMSQKMKREHALAVASAVEALAPHFAASPHTRTSVVEQGRILHMATTISGVVEASATFADLLADLHPTAAVGGTPRSEALALIRELEAPRGRYSGPVGWFNGAGEGAFALALRCVQLEGTEITAFAGGGLVEGSEIDEELAETELKLEPIRKALAQLSSA